MSFGKLYGEDARYLADIFASFPKRVRNAYELMTLRLWSHLQSSGKPRFVSIGRRTLAEECGVTERIAQHYLEYMENAGWLVRTGSTKRSGGQFVKRTFWWHIDDGAEHVHVQPLNMYPPLDVQPPEHVPPSGCSTSETESQRAGRTPPLSRGVLPPDPIPEPTDEDKRMAASIFEDDAT